MYSRDKENSIPTMARIMQQLTDLESNCGLKNESKESVTNTSMQANEVKALTKKIIESMELIITKELSHKQVVEKWKSLKAQLGILVYSRQIVPDYYIEVVTHISKNFSKLHVDIKSLCDQTILDCTRIALSHLSTLAQDTSKHAYKVSVQRAKLLFAIQNFPAILITFNLNFKEELEKEGIIIADHLKESSGSIEELNAENVLKEIKSLTKDEESVTLPEDNLDERSKKILQALELDPDQYETLSQETITQLKEVVDKHLLKQTVMCTRVAK